jgi:succinyl-diaminopimelate desuccinylase
MRDIAHADLLARIDPEAIARVCADLVRFNTSNPPGNESRAAEYVADYLRPAGFSVDLLPYPGDAGRASVVARLRRGVPAAGDGRGALMFSSHLDVVPVGTRPWRYPPFAGTIAEGKVWGRGAADLKGGLAAMLVAAKILAESGIELGGDLVVAATAGEETGMVGAAQVAEWPGLGPIEAIIISEPTDNVPALAERGVLWLDLTTQGKTAHGSTPRLGRNAIDMMRVLLDELDALEISFTPHPLLGNFTSSINMIQGGAAQNVVPDQCFASIDMRTVPGQRHCAILRQIEELIDDLRARRPGFEATAEIHFDLPSVDSPEDDPTVMRFLATAATVGGRPARPTAVRFATEAGVFGPNLPPLPPHERVPVIIYGPGHPDLAHQDDEHVPIEKMVTAARVYLAAALDILG